LPPGARASVLAAGPLAVGGLALVARSIAGLLLAAAATLLHALTYDPFRDIGCARVCLEVPSRLEMSTADLTRVVVVLVLAAAALTVVAAARTATLAAWSAALGAALLAVLAVVRWRTVGDPDAFGVVLLAATMVPALVAAPRLVTWVRQARERRAVRRLLHRARPAAHAGRGPRPQRPHPRSAPGLAQRRAPRRRPGAGRRGPRQPAAGGGRG
jgi:hypothetical protein